MTFTPTQQRLLEALADGLPHRPEDLLAAVMVDREATVKNLQWHMSIIRQKLRLKGEDLICEIFNRRMHYRHIRLLISSAK